MNRHGQLTNFDLSLEDWPPFHQLQGPNFSQKCLKRGGGLRFWQSPPCVGQRWWVPRIEACIVAGAMSPAPSRLAPLPSPTGLSPRPRPKSLFVRLNSFRKASLLSLSSTASSPQCEAPAFTFDDLLKLHKRKAVHPPQLHITPSSTQIRPLTINYMFCLNPSKRHTRPQPYMLRPDTRSALLPVLFFLLVLSFFHVDNLFPRISPCLMPQMSSLSTLLPLDSLALAKDSPLSFCYDSGLSL